MFTYQQRVFRWVYPKKPLSFWGVCPDVLTVYSHHDNDVTIDVITTKNDKKTRLS